MNRKVLIFSIWMAIISSACNSEYSAQKKIPLNEGWQFCEVGKAHWLPAEVPGVVHTDLLKAGEIPEFFYGCNEKKLQWIGEKDWVYRLSFEANKDWKRWHRQELVFEGLDTWAEIFLNGEKILDADNMFRKWKADVKDKLLPGKNVLEVRFKSALQKFLTDSVALGYPLPGGRWNTSRKAAYHFGWDWGPRFITCGIWKPVYLQLSGKISVSDVWISNDSITAKKASLSLHLSIDSYLPKGEKVTVILKNEGERQSIVQSLILPSDGVGQYKIPFSISQPKLWWCNGLGEPYLYHWRLEVKTSSGWFYIKSLTHGIRTVELVRNSDDYGESFFLKLNDVPVYAKGANYIPSHSFPTEVTPEHYRRVMREAVFANMNMLRIWGGGIYENDYFYELADSLGLMIWQDFMYACALYPGTYNFLENARLEAMDQVKRLRQHPSVVIWCGNNESDEAWHNWGYQKQYGMSPELQDTIWKHYTRLFHEILPEVLKQWCFNVPYVSSSPQTGWGRPESMVSGDSHYWGVWWGKEPFEKYLEKIPRFMSEFGFQAMPEISTLRLFQPSSADTLFSPQLRCHQKHPTGFETIATYLQREGLEPATVEEYIYHTQLLQARGIGLGIAAQRASRPRCMGSLYWQLNDCWPVTSWSSVDFSGNRKALHYVAKELYDTFALSILPKFDTLQVIAVNDTRSEVKGQLEINFRFFDGNVKKLISNAIKIRPLASQEIFSLPLKLLPEAGNYIVEAIVKGQGFERLSTFIPGKLSQLRLKNTQIMYKIEPTKGGYFLIFSADQLVAWLQVYLSETPALFSDNFFHLWPGKQHRVFCQTSLDIQAFEKQLRYYSLNQYLTKNKINP